MRRLAKRLGVAPNALYTHVRGKADLVAALVDEVYADVDLVPQASDQWTEQLAALSRTLRQHLLIHPSVVPLALQQRGLGPHGLRLGEAIYNVLRPAGFSDEAVVGTVSALHTYVLGFVALEAPGAGTDHDGDDEFVRRLSAFFAALPPERFPHHVELAPLLTRFSSDDQFEFGLRTFLTGLAAQQPDRGTIQTPQHAPTTAPSPTMQPNKGRHKMADTSPHDRPPETSDGLLLDTDVAERRCWRCLQMFTGDPTRAPTPTPEWWLCDPCDRILLAPAQRAA